MFFSRITKIIVAFDTGTKAKVLPGLVSLKPFLKQLHVSLLLLETETCKLSWRNFGRVIGHRTLQTQLPYVWWFIQPTVTTCFIFFTTLSNLNFPKDTVVCRDKRLPSEMKNLKVSDSKFSETFKNPCSTAIRRRCKL